MCIYGLNEGRRQPMQGLPVMIAVDWGSSRFRAYALDRNGSLLDAAACGKGVFSCRGKSDYEQVLRQMCGGWLRQAPGALVLMAGMVGSRNGWMETDYVACPVDLDGLSCRMVPMPDFEGSPVRIVPGISNLAPSGLHDLMRGEETQLLGLIDPQAESDLAACFPGTHGKWAQMEGGRIARFSTFMTGELFSALSHLPSLAPLLGATEAGLNEAAFLQGVRLSGAGGGLSHQLFSIRARALVEGQSSAAGFSQLSGLLIGTEIRAGLELHSDLGEMVVVGNDELSKSYCLAFSQFGIHAQSVPGQQAFTTGAWRLAMAGGLLA